MSFCKPASIAVLIALAAQVSAHGIVTGIVADGVYNRGYHPDFSFWNEKPVVAGWSTPTLSNQRFVGPEYLNEKEIICHEDSTPGGTHVKIAAGGTLELQWTEWPEGHTGPVLDYLAPCPGHDCTNVDKTALHFVKVQERGYDNGEWATDALIANNNTAVTTLPSGIAPGKYVLRHEIIAHHSSHERMGAQFYPQCVNLEITGTGTDDLSGGVSATEFYDWDHPGVHFNLYQPYDKYEIPGPPMHQFGTSSGSSSGGGNAMTIQTVPNPTPSTSTAPAKDAQVTDGPIDSASPPYNTDDWPRYTDLPAKPIASAKQEGGRGNSPASFSTTVTGRIGKPTKFTCHAEE